MRAAVGRVDDAFWVMPVGVDADRVSVDAMPVVPGQRKVLYSTDQVEVISCTAPQRGITGKCVVPGPTDRPQAVRSVRKPTG